MNSRRIKAPLSLHEELTLRRIAVATGPVETLAHDVVERLRHFGLIDDANRLTLAGRDRCDGLERPPRADIGGPEESHRDRLQRIARASR